MYTSIDKFIDCLIRDCDDETLRDKIVITEIDKNDYHVVLDTGCPYDSIDFKIKLYETCIVIYANKYADNTVENDETCIATDYFVDANTLSADEILQATNEYLKELGCTTYLY